MFALKLLCKLSKICHCCEDTGSWLLYLVLISHSDCMFESYIIEHPFLLLNCIFVLKKKIVMAETRLFSVCNIVYVFFQPGNKVSTSVAPKFSEIPTEMFKEVPDRVVELVQKMLDTPPAEFKSQDSVSMAASPPDGTKMVLNVWDFAGKEDYYTMHQVFLSSRAIYVFVFSLTHDLEQTDSSTQVICCSIPNQKTTQMCVKTLSKV